MNLNAFQTSSFPTCILLKGMTVNASVSCTTVPLRKSFLLITFPGIIEYDTLSLVNIDLYPAAPKFCAINTLTSKPVR